MTVLKVKGYRILIDTDEIEEVSEGGIVLTASKNQKRLEQHAVNVGTVLQIGELAWSDKLVDGKRVDPWCEVGDRVVVSKYAGKFVYDPVTDKEFCVLNDEDVICVIEDK